MFKKLFDPGYKELKKAEKIALKIDALKDEMKKLSDEDIKNKTKEFKERYNKGESLDSLLVEAYALCREAATRVTGMTPYFVQLLGAIVIHNGNIAEMKTGEGKTLTSVLPAYLNALSGNSVHIVTVNEYLASREANGEIGDLFRFLGLTVGLNLRELSSEQKKEAYACDILYSTNSELGFDYLRDHMVLYKEQMVQRGLDFAIIDEVDSILIDEARTPLIISGGEKNTGNLYVSADRFVKSLKDEDFELDIEAKSVSLTYSGIDKAERYYNISNLFDLDNVSLLHHINNALRANLIMKNEVEYVVQDNQVLIVDQFTGRILKGRQFSEGLHQALEAKEGVEIKKETVTVATITYQNFFRMYSKLSGMTGTAKTEEEEFMEIYNMYVVEVPTNKPVIRQDLTDLIFSNVKAKYKAIIADVKEKYTRGQPVLLGTIAVETSELLSMLLKKEGIKHEVLNAKNHEREAEIIEKAGQKYSVTIATNMAGRGTDIKLGEGVRELGGLAVIGSERHESRRIDNQLRGRSGRQGDVGSSRFYLSADDELLQRFGGEIFKSRLEMVLKYQGDINAPLESKTFSKFINGAQKKIEGMNYDSRKDVLKYDEVLKKQRDIIYKQRKDVLIKDSIYEEVVQMIKTTISNIVSKNVKETSKSYIVEDEAIFKELNGDLFDLNYFSLEELEKQDDVENYILNKALEKLEEKKNSHPEIFNEFLKVVVLRVVDTYWTKHIDVMSELRQSVRLQAYGQEKPIVYYQQRGFQLFEEMVANISKDVTRYVVRAQIRDNTERTKVTKNEVASDGKEEKVKKKPIVTDKKPGRNDPCSCGSGKKYKNCCGI